MEQNGEEVASTDVVEEIGTNKEQGNVEGNWLTNVQEDTIKLFKKLDDITAAISLNKPRLSKVEEDNNQMF